MPTARSREDLRPVAALFAFYLLVQGAWGSYGRYSVYFLVALTGALAVLVVWGDRLRPAPATPLLSAMSGLVGLLVLFSFLTRQQLACAVRPEGVLPRLLGVVAAALLTGGWAVRSRRFGIGLLAAAAAVFGLYLAAQLVRTPSPVMDVWSISMEATQALLHGQNPYARTYSDVYAAAGVPGYGYASLYIYLPGLLLHYAPAVALGLDVRWVSLAAMTAGLLVFGLLVRARRDEAPDAWQATVPVVACLLFWFHGGQAFLLEQAWPESLILLYLCLAAWLWDGAPVAAAVALALGLTLKQTTWFCAPFLLALAATQRRWRMAAGVAIGVALVVAPFFLWDPAAFFHNVVVDLLQKRPRPDALSWAAVALRHWPAAQPAALGVSLLLYGFAFWRLLLHLRRASPDPVAATVRWTALGLLGFFLCLKQSFYNYYYLSAGLLTLYACLPAGPPARSNRPSRPSRT